MFKAKQAAGWCVVIAIFAAAVGRGAAGDALDLLRGREARSAGYLDLDYRNASLQRIVFDLQNARPGVSLEVKAANVAERQDLLAKPMSVGPVRGLSWEDAVRYVAGKTGLAVDMSRESEGVVSLEKTSRFTGVFNGVRLGDAISLIIEHSGANVVVSPNIDANAAVFLQLNDVPWREALRSVVNAHGYVMDIDDESGVVRVATRAEVPVTVETATRRLRYLQPGGEADAAAALVEALRHMASDNGTVLYDRRTNSLTLTDIPEKLAAMSRVADSMDVAPYQVEMETSLIDMDLDPAGMIAANWLVRNAPADGGETVWEAVCATHGPDCPSIEAMREKTTAAPTYSAGTLSTAEAAAALRASANSREVSLTQAPRMTVLDREAASVSVGGVDAAGNFSGIRMTAKPRVCDGGDRVLLEICYEQYGVPSPCGGMVRTVRTTMLLDSGETGIIAGLMRDAPERTVRKGLLGRGTAERRTVRHSVIMVTPIVMIPPDDDAFEADIEALRDSLAALDD